MEDRINYILNTFDKIYGTDLVCYLEHDEPWQLLIATILSAQCTDERVNIVTKELFVKYPSVDAFANASLKELERDIYSTGFYHNKAKNIIACCNKLVSDYDSQVPSTMDKLLTLPGVGRKTANVILGNVYHIPSVVVDTHVGRISRRLGLTSSKDPAVVEKDLMKVLPEDHWILYNIQAIAFGREICTSQRPKCAECPLSNICARTITQLTKSATRNPSPCRTKVIQ